MALPPKTPAPIVSAYASAFDSMTRDPAFVAAIGKIGTGLKFRSRADVQSLLGALAQTPQSAIDSIGSMLRAQDLRVN